jgi:hypothetical protein
MPLIRIPQPAPENYTKNYRQHFGTDKSLGRTPDIKQEGFDDATPVAAIARQGDPEGARRAAPSNLSAGTSKIRRKSIS